MTGRLRAAGRSGPAVRTALVAVLALLAAAPTGTGLLAVALARRRVRQRLVLGTLCGPVRYGSTLP